MPHRAGCAVLVAVLVAVLMAGCGDGDTVPEPPASPGPLPSRSALRSPPPVASPSAMVPASPATNTCPATHPQAVPLYASDVRAAANLDGVTLCTDGRSGTWLKNAALVPWVVDSPVLTPPVTAPIQVLLFREAMGQRQIRGAVIAPGEAWAFSSAPSSAVSMHLETGPSWAWQTLAGARTVAEGKVRDGFATRVAGRSAPRQAVLQCALAAYDAGKDLQSGGQQQAQTPALHALDKLGLAQQGRACSTSLTALQNVEPQPLLTAADLATELGRPQSSAIFDETAAAARRLCAASPRC